MAPLVNLIGSLIYFIIYDDIVFHPALSEFSFLWYEKHIILIAVIRANRVRSRQPEQLEFIVA